MEASRTPWIQASSPDGPPADAENPRPDPGKGSGWLGKSLALALAVTIGTVVTMGIFVILPPPGGETRFEARRRSQPVKAGPAGGGFELFGPFRHTAGSVAFSWPILGDTLFDSYEVHYSKQPEFTPNRSTLFAGRIEHPSMTSIEVTGLDCASTYYFKVRKNDRDGRYADSRELGARTDGCPDTTRHNQVYFASVYDEYDDLYGDLYDDDEERPDEYGYGDSDPDDRSADDVLSAGARRPAEAVRLYPAAYVSSGSAHAIWSDDYSPGFVAYEVHVSTSPGTGPSGTTRRAELRSRYRSRYVLDDLGCGETYYVTVRTRYDDGSVRDSNVERFTTQPCGSSRPSAAGQGY